MRPLVLASLLLAACSGPPAPDAVLCRDVIHRLCFGPVCGVVSTQLGVTSSQLGVTPECETKLLANTGCASDEFAFTTPTRAHFLSCRGPLVQVSASTEVPPLCDSVGEMFSNCPDVVHFLGGTP